MIVMCRTACLGQWVIDAIFGHSFQENNQQKTRIDLFLDLINGVYNRPSLSHIKPWLARNDIGQLIKQQEELSWLQMDNPDILIMDSYAELTDQKFVHKDNWAFCCNYSDLDHTRYGDELTCYGLLDHNKLYFYYDVFFDYIKKTYNIPIIFIQFPLTFETRKQYLDQGQAINDAICNLSEKYSIQNIIADPEFIEQKDDEIYHFTTKTIKNMAAKIKL